MKTILSFVFVLGVISSASAQDDISHCTPEPAPPRIYIGFTGGYGRTFHSEGISNPVNKNQNFEAAYSNSFFIGLSGKYILGKRAVDGSESTSHLVFKTYYSNLNTAKNIIKDSRTISGPNGESIIAETENTVSFKASFINTELILSQQIPVINAFSFGAGLGVAFPLTGVMEKRFEILQPAEATFLTDDPRFKYEENGRVIIMEENDISKVIYYAKVGIDYYNVFPFGNRLIVTPSIFYNFALNRALTTEDFKINALQFGVDFKFAL